MEKQVKFQRFWLILSRLFGSVNDTEDATPRPVWHPTGTIGEIGGTTHRNGMAGTGIEPVTSGLVCLKKNHRALNTPFGPYWRLHLENLG